MSNTGQKLYMKAKRLIPGGTQLLSKRPEMFLPNQWPSYYDKAKGIEVIDMNGNTYLDMGSMGIGACILGYADKEVDAAVKEAIDKGVASTLNAPEEVELAELLCELHPWAGMVRYTRSGGEAMSVAIRLARAHTQRDVVAFCGYHGWSDWYLAANLSNENSLDGHLLPGLEPAGVPRGLTGTAFPFHYNRIDELEEIVNKHGKSLAAVVMEPQRGEPPVDGFLEKVWQIASDTGAVLIFDEITTGFRMTNGGIHLINDVFPDIAVFAKCMANGYAMAAVIGKEEVMQAAQKTFISSTNWTERVGPVAALATIRKIIREKVHKHIIRIGEQVMEGWEESARKTGLSIDVGGLPTVSHFSFQYDNDMELLTLFNQLMLDRGYLAFNQFKPSFAHTEEDVKLYISNVREVFAILKDALVNDSVKSLLKGPVAHDGFYRLA